MSSVHPTPQPEQAPRTRRLRRKQLREVAKCQDCSSNVHVVGTHRVQTEHDPTCPWYQAHGARPFTQLAIVSGVGHGGAR